MGVTYGEGNAYRLRTPYPRFLLGFVLLDLMFSV